MQLMSFAVLFPSSFPNKAIVFNVSVENCEIKFMNKAVKYLSLLCVLLYQVTGATAQDQNDVMINAWLELGSLTFTPTKQDKSAGVDAAIKFQRNKLLANMQYHDYFDSESANGGFELFTDANHYHAGNFLIGITNKNCRVGHASVSTGLGAFWGRFDNISQVKFATIGWPIEAAASLNIFPFIGINMKVFTNINSKHSFIGFGMDLQLGKLRKYNWQEIIPNKIPIPR